MKLPKSTPTEMIEDLKDLARAGFVETFPHVPEEEQIEAEAAEMISAMVEDFRRIADGATDAPEIARKWLEEPDDED